MVRYTRNNNIRRCRKTAIIGLKKNKKKIIKIRDDRAVSGRVYG